jgi:hypothetical protein
MEGIMAVDRVSREPFSGSDSLLTGKYTGKFANWANKSADRIFHIDESLRVFAPLADFMRRSEQGIISPTSGNLHSLMPTGSTHGSLPIGDEIINDHYFSNCSQGVGADGPTIQNEVCCGAAA